MINSDIFREYDIRGIAKTDLKDEVVLVLGGAIGSYFREHGCRQITVGQDCRQTSARLRDRLTEGILATGLKIIDIGTCTTPLLYFSLHHLHPDGGIMITGSHNPPEYNGFKIAIGSSTLYGEQIQEIRRIAEAGQFVREKGSLRHRTLFQEYQQELLRGFSQVSNLGRVVLDCGNGTASLIAPQLYRQLGWQVSELYCEMDGGFPNHHPDPTVVENLKDLVDEVQSTRADLGVAFDGDADRIGVVDDRGEVIWGDQLMILYSREILRQRPGATIIAEVKCSQNLYQDIEKHGGQAIMWKTGHSLIKAKMKDTGAVLAGEMSGHMFFADRYFGYDDAVYAGARLLEILAGTKRKLSELLSDVPKTYATPEIRVECPEHHKFRIVRQAQEFFQRHYPTVTVDGVRIQFEDGWGLVRASNTQPVLVLRFEAGSPQRLKEIRSLVETKLEDFTRHQIS